jgi:glycosyltransferase involved in cell wall biosynthesis
MRSELDFEAECTISNKPRIRFFVASIDMKVRVLQFADVINRYDFIDNIVQYADQNHFEVGVCVRTKDANIAAPVYRERTPHWVLDGLSRRDIPKTAWRLSRILKEWRVDILHAHHYDQALIGYLATRLNRRTRLVVGRHYSDAIYRSSRGLKRRALLAAEGIVNRAATRIVVPSRFIADLLVNRQSVPNEKVIRIPYGFAIEKYSIIGESTVRLRQELASGSNFVIANFSRLHEEKGQRFLIEAVARLRTQTPGLMAWIVGEGPERPSLERQIREAGLSDVVRLLGWRRDAMELMAAADAIIQPTLQEAFSQVMAEALWMCKPLIISDVSGATDVVTDGENGLLIRQSDAEALSTAIQRLAHDPSLRERLGQAGRVYVENFLTVSKVIPQYEAMYSDIARD